MVPLLICLVLVVSQQNELDPERMKNPMTVEKLSGIKETIKVGVSIVQFLLYIYQPIDIAISLIMKCTK